MGDSNSTAGRLEQLRAKLAQFEARGLAVPGPPVGAAELDAFEAQAGVSLPEEFRAFVETIGLGGVGPAAGLHDIPRWYEALLDVVPGILAMPSLLDPARGYGDYDDCEDPAQGAIALTSEGAGAPYTLLIVAGPNRGRLARYDIDTEWSQWVELAWPPAPAGFFDWYEGWLDLALAGVQPTFYGGGLIGSQAKLLRALRDSDRPQRQVRALAGLAQRPALDEQVLEEIRSVYGSGTPAVRAAALPLLVAHPAEQDAVELLKAALRDSAPELRRVAVRELSRRGAVDALAPAVDDEDPSIAKAALIALDDSRFVDLPLLARLFRRPELRPQVVSKLGKFPSTDALALLGEGLGDDSPDVRRISAFSIGALGLPDGVPLLRHAAESETDATVRRALDVSLRKLGASTDA